LLQIGRSADFFDILVLSSRNGDSHRVIFERNRTLKMIGMGMSADNSLNPGWIDPIGLHPVEEGRNPVKVTGIDQKRDLAIYEDTITVVFSGIVPKIDIQVFGDFHCCLSVMVRYR
jgi:hypothetical protein